MIARLVAAALFLVAVAAGSAHAQTQGRRATAVVELFTSQGCTQCPRANRLLGQFSREDDVLSLTFPVGIWDYLGWADTFARPEFNARQRAYSNALRENRRTPQLIFNGARQVSASSWDDARAILDQERAQPVASPTISMTRLRNGRVQVAIGASARTTPADVWYVDYSTDAVTVLITRGLNRNRSIPHYNLVERIVRLGAWTGDFATYEHRRCPLSCAVIVQEQNGGAVVVAAFMNRR